MKKAFTVFSSIAISGSALAHTSALPHAHQGGETSWLSAIACVLALTVAVAAALRIAKSRRVR